LLDKWSYLQNYLKFLLSESREIVLTIPSRQGRSARNFRKTGRRWEVLRFFWTFELREELKFQRRRR
jgi:hypothetical protein